MKKGRFFPSWLAVMLCFVLGAGVNAAQAASPAKPVIIKMCTWTASPQANVFTRASIWHMQEVERRSKGLLKVEYYHSGSLVPAKETVAGLKSGVADVAFVNHGHEPGKVPLGTVGSLPAIGRGYYSGGMAYAELMRTPEMKAEMDQNNIVYLGPLGVASYGVWTKRPVRSIADLKGKKILASGEHSLILNAFGAVPVAIVSTESYSALEKGILDGGLANPGYANDYRWQEVCPHYYELLFGAKTQMVAMNKHTWNKLPPEIQKLFTDLHDEACRKGHEIYEGNAENKLKEFVAKGIVKVTQPSAADVALMEKTAHDVIWVKWVKKMEEKGLAGQKVLDNWRKLNQKYDAQSPFKK